MANASSKVTADSFRSMSTRSTSSESKALRMFLTLFSCSGSRMILSDSSENVFLRTSLILLYVSSSSSFSRYWLSRFETATL
uniref:Uncharacterized protein n=1 Tax=Arundo donax TaxID=35708 RepID=A0A0A9E8Z0_ARUDO